MPISCLRDGKPNDKSLMLIQHGCMSLDDILLALHDYVATGDQVLLVLLADYRRSMTTVEKVLWP